MRVLGVCLVVMLAVLPGAAVAATPAKKKPVAAEPAPPPPPMPTAQMKTSEQVKRESVEGAATSPLRDLNLMRTKIPDVLLMALVDPYARPPKNWKCAQLIAHLQPLNAALGPDIDILPAGDEDLTERGRETALGAAADFASDAIPFRGWVRKLSGAERHDKLVQAAIIAGFTRRAYLKGLGETKGCNPPATPSHERAGSIAVRHREGPLSPLYPTRLAPDEPVARTETRPPAAR